MFCQRCGAEIPDGQNVCPGCYAPVRRPGLLSRLLGSLFKPRQAGPPLYGSGGGHNERTIVRSVQKVRIKDGDTGEERVYDSLDDVPPEIRERIEALRAAGGPGTTQQTFTFKDASGQERTYHSVEEMPPDVRAIYERLLKEHGLDG